MFRDYKAVVLDIEGVLFAGKEALPGGREVVEALDRRGIPYRFLTNNSFRTGAEMSAHMRELGIPATDGMIVNALDHAGACLGRMGAEGPVLLIGGAALRGSLERAGFEVLSGDDEARAKTVLVGLDQGLSHASLSAAARAVARGARYVAMNPDVRAPLEGGGFQIGTGGIAAAVTAAGGREPEHLGKPSPYLFEEVLDQLGVRAGEALMVGDSLRADIAGAKGAGMAAVWLNRWGKLSGDPDIKPDLEIKQVDEILPHLPERLA